MMPTGKYLKKKRNNLPILYIKNVIASNWTLSSTMLGLGDEVKFQDLESPNVSPSFSFDSALSTSSW